MRDTFTWEKNMMPFADVWYHSLGYETINRSVQNPEYDLLADGIKIEEKFLFCESDYDMALIEIIQDLKSGGLGWFYHCRAHFLSWFYCPITHTDCPRTVYLINFPQLVEYLTNDLSDGNKKWRKFQVCNKHYGITLNLPISWQDLVNKNIAKRYAALAAVREAFHD